VRAHARTISLLAALAVCGCGGTTTKSPSETMQRGVASRFAAALFRGDGAAARALLVRKDDDGALAFLVQRAAAPWKSLHASLRPRPRRAGNQWLFGYSGTHTHRDGRFERESGELVVFVVPTGTGAGVRFFAFKDVRRRFSTHHDAVLLPSNR
jgi:hypothetical protein